MPPSSKALPPDNRADEGLASSGGSKIVDDTIADCSYRRALLTISNSRGSKPSDGHSSASGLATNASCGVRAAAVGGLRGEAAASAEWHTMGAPRRRHHAKMVLQPLQTQLPTGSTHQKRNTLWRQERRPTFSSDPASRHPSEPNTAQFGVVVLTAGRGAWHSQSSSRADRDRGRLWLTGARTMSFLEQCSRRYGQVLETDVNSPEL